MQLIKQKLKDTANSAQESDVQVGQMVSTPEIVLHQWAKKLSKSVWQELPINFE